MGDIQEILIPINTIIDTDIGLLKLVQFEYRVSDMFLDSILDAFELEYQQYFLYTRSHSNPLSVITKETYWDSIDGMYEQFISTQYDKIIDYGCNTLVMDLLKLIILGDTPMRFTVLCNTVHDEEVILSRLHSIGIANYSTIVQNDWDRVDTGKYTDIYVKYASDLDRFRHITKQNLYISTHALNMIIDEQSADGQILDAHTVIKYMRDNIIKTFSLYNFNNIILPVG